MDTYKNHSNLDTPHDRTDEIEFDVSVCSAEFTEGCRLATVDRVD